MRVVPVKPWCSNSGCDKPTRWQVMIEVRAPLAQYPTAPPLQISTSLGVCDEHKGETKLDDVLTDDGWNKIVDALRADGKVDPDRSTARVYFDPVGAKA